MRVYNKVEKQAFQQRHLTINNEKPLSNGVWVLKYCGRPVYEHSYFHFCKSEKNRLIKSGYKESAFTYSKRQINKTN